jgi:predicted AlkP superfamily phosphohydrolase/phosphomutase
LSHSNIPKVIIIGVDGLEPSRIMEYTPDFKSRIDISFDLLSTLPPDTALAFPVAYTGLGLNKLLKTTPFRLSEYKIEESRLERLVAKRIIGKTYWDRLSHKNYKVCVLFPYLIRSIYDINATLITATADGKISVSSPKTAEHICDSVTELWNKKEEDAKRTPVLRKDHIGEFTRNINDFRKKEKILFKILDEASYDLVYFYTDILESQHLFWNDLKYTKYAYNLVENFLLHLIDKYSDEYLIIVHGDHGFVRREKYLVNVAKIAGNIFSRRSSNIVQFMKNFGLRFLAPEVAYILHLEDVAYRSYLKVKTKSGVKFTSDYLEIMDAALRSRSNIFYDPAFELRGFCGFYVKNESGFQRISLALKPYIKKLYDGRHDSRLKAIMVPTSNVVFELKENYATFYNEYAPSVMMNPRERSLPGVHGFRTALYVHSGPYKLKALTHQTALMIDIAPTVLNLFGVNDKCEGSPLVEVQF